MLAQQQMHLQHIKHHLQHKRNTLTTEYTVVQKIINCFQIQLAINILGSEKESAQTNHLCNQKLQKCVFKQLHVTQVLEIREKFNGAYSTCSTENLYKELSLQPYVPVKTPTPFQRFQKF
eukprot:TRINITY_DN17398_c1_g2_i1.p8 TRINITY_DN17398_c1_g2~~TRINITY_DN17398_c1_g2_i1.p8  ORF type:complete len:120 (-),score=0.31 TRINITY_DN17398_c1_g2_i1:292-651(-)